MKKVLLGILIGVAVCSCVKIGCGFLKEDVSTNDEIVQTIEPTEKPNGLVSDEYRQEIEANSKENTYELTTQE